VKGRGEGRGGKTAKGRIYWPCANEEIFGQSDFL